MTTKLTKQDWMDFSLKELSKHGHGQLTANRLASKLGVSRGSFYWHFKDLQDFETSLLNRWAGLTTDDVIEDLKPLESPKLRLLSLIKRAMNENMRLERAVRSWATSNISIAKVVTQVDTRRIEYIEDILQSLGINKIDTQTRAKMLYWASIGRMMMPDPQSSTISHEQLDRFADLLVS